MIDAVSENDVPVSIVERGEVFELKANFRVVHVLVFNSRGELLIQRLSATRERHPGYWGSSVAGYLFAGESYEEAARRKLWEELRVQSAHLDPIGKTHMNDEGCTKFISIFAVVNDGPFEYDHEHISELEFVPLGKLRDLLSLAENRFTPTFFYVLDFLERRRQPFWKA